MFVLPAIALPFLLMRAIHRLLHIPMRRCAGSWRFPARRPALLVATVALLTALVHTLLFAADSLSACLELEAYALAYPLVYLAAAWIFYHDLTPTAPHTPTLYSSTKYP